MLRQLTRTQSANQCTGCELFFFTLTARDSQSELESRLSFKKLQQVLCNHSHLRWRSYQSTAVQTDRQVTDNPEPPPPAWLKTNKQKFHSVTLKGQRLQWIYYHNVNPINYTNKKIKAKKAKKHKHNPDRKGHLFTSVCHIIARLFVSHWVVHQSRIRLTSLRCWQLW